VSALRYALLGLAIVLAILSMVWPARPLRDQKAERLRALASYFVSLAFGIAIVLLAPLGHGAGVPFYATLALVCWVALGALWMARRYPGLPNPDWVLMRWSPADWGLIVLLVLSSLAAVFG
jgi:hypothetical protein